MFTALSPRTLLGYVGAPDDINKEDAKKFTFYQGDVEGKSNIEKVDGRISTRQTGRALFAAQRQGHDRRRVREDPPQQGANVYLTIDARIQAIAEEAMRAVGRAGAVVVDPNNGNVLAMVSVPSFDPNTFIPSIKAKDWEALQKDEGDPLVNRAISALAAGLDIQACYLARWPARKKSRRTRISIAAAASVMAIIFSIAGSRKNMRHGTIGLADAIKVSCDSFFYQYGNAAGIESIDAVGNARSGRRIGIAITGEQTGNMPGPEWMQVHYPRERWTQAYTANVSIGQGYTLVSPLQLAMAYAADRQRRHLLLSAAGR